VSAASGGTVYLFPGQGSQARGMGRELFDRYPDHVERAESVLGYSVRRACLEATGLDEPNLRQTQYVQPLLYVVNALNELDRRREGLPGPDYLAGHSLGEYNALLAAECFDFETGLRLVRERGRLMGQADGGGMLAVVGAEVADVTALLERAGLVDVDVANWNSAEQLVLSGTKEALAAATTVLTDTGLGRCVPLQVSAAFHSRHMSAAAEEFRAVLDAVMFADPRIPVIANVTARPYEPGTVAQLLAEQIRKPVRWWESLSLLIERGVRNAVEVGPGTVLGKLWSAALAKPATSQKPDTPSQPTTVRSSPTPKLRPAALGSSEFRRDYRLRYAYLAGAMYRGIASEGLVTRLASAGLMGFLGTAGFGAEEVAKSVARIRGELGPSTAFGVNLIATPDNPALEDDLVRVFLDERVHHVEAAGFTSVSPAIIAFRFRGARRTPDGTPTAVRHVLAKVSRPEVAAAFMAPPSADVLDHLVASGRLSREEAEIAAHLPVSGDICVEADSGGHTDAGNPYALTPAMMSLRDEAQAERGYAKRIRVGAAGGIGTPESIAASFTLGADFVLTGSVNQCTVEAGTSDLAKDMLAVADVQDTAYAPAGDMFEIGARVQVLRKGTLFAARANKLYQLWRQYDSLADIGEDTRRSLEQRCFRRSLDEVWAQARTHLAAKGGGALERAEANPKVRMGHVFKWYFAHTTRVALEGVAEEKVNFQIHCGPALGAFNRFAASTDLADWRARHVDTVAERLMTGAAERLAAAGARWLESSPEMRT
jgi:trans-AT polyketide synthase, acyltransferase and oxidoreductase domains